MEHAPHARSALLTDTRILLLAALASLAAHLVCITEYGYFRDELYYIACSNHPAWGYVDHPPFSIFVLVLVRQALGESLVAIRILPAVAGAVVVFVTGRMARDLGGGRVAQIVAALAALTAPVILGNAGRYFSMNAFDLLFWALASWIAIRIFRDDAGKLWLLFGIVAGLGILNKYSMAFFLAGLGVGMVLTPARKHFLSAWFWMGAVLGGLLVLPHVLWEMHAGFPTAEFVRNAALEKNMPVTPLAYLYGQFGMAGPGNAVIWIGGLIFAFGAGGQKRWRPFGIAYVVIFLAMALQNGKTYYLSPVYPLMFALGGCGIESLARTLAARWVLPATLGLMLLSAAVFTPYAIPVLPVESFVRYEAFLGITPEREERGQPTVLPQYYMDMFGWEEMADTVANVYRRLSADEQRQCFIYVRNYGEAAAIDFFGRKYGLPAAACAHNSYWYWKPAEWTGEVSIIFGSRMDTAASAQDLRRFFGDVQLATVTASRYGMPYEIGRPIFVCRKAKITLDQLWARDRHFI